MTDGVDHPPHYKQGEIECIDGIRASMSSAEFQGYCKGNVIKYVWRYQHKGHPLKDLHKAAWYLRRLIEETESRE